MMKYFILLLLICIAQIQAVQNRAQSSRRIRRKTHSRHRRVHVNNRNTIRQDEDGDEEGEGEGMQGWLRISSKHFADRLIHPAMPLPNGDEDDLEGDQDDEEGDDDEDDDDDSDDDYSDDDDKDYSIEIIHGYGLDDEDGDDEEGDDEDGDDEEGDDEEGDDEEGDDEEGDDEEGDDEEDDDDEGDDDEGDDEEGDGADCPGIDYAQEFVGDAVDYSLINENAMFRKNEGFGQEAEGEAEEIPSIDSFWFRLDEDNLYYTQDNENMVVLGSINVHNIITIEENELDPERCFSVISEEGDDWNLCASSPEEQDEWMCALFNATGTTGEGCPGDEGDEDGDEEDGDEAEEERRRRHRRHRLNRFNQINRLYQNKQVDPDHRSNWNISRFQSKPKKNNKDVIDVIESQNTYLPGVHRYASKSKKSKQDIIGTILSENYKLGPSYQQRVQRLSNTMKKMAYFVRNQ